MRRLRPPLALLCLAPLAALEIDRIRYPADSGVVVAGEHGVKGDGSDCTAALNALLKQYGSDQRIVYLADGIYQVSDTLVLGRRMFVSLVGESRDGVVIRLKDRCPGFQDAAAPRTVLQGSTLVATAFSVNFVNLTVDTGSGNPGAIGMFFGANNQGSLRNCSIRSGDGTGAVGLDLRDAGVGPLLVQDVAVRGFDTGIAVAKCSRTMERVALEGQRGVGMEVEGGLLFLREIAYRGTGPFLRMAEEPRRLRGVAAERTAGRNGLVSTVVLDRARLEGLPGAAAHPAFATPQVLWMRDAEVRGFAAVAGPGLGPVPSPPLGRVEEWCSHPVATLFGTPARSLRLAAPDPPGIPWEADLARWASPERFRQEADGDDDAPAIQRAIDSGATTVYLPYRQVPSRNGKYQVRRFWRLKSTVELRGQVRRLLGCGATCTTAGEDMPSLLIGDQGPRAVAVQDLRGNFGDKLVVRCRAPGRTVVLRQLAACTVDQEGGELHLQDVVAAKVRCARGSTWARQLNVERGQPKMRNEGGLLWVLGFKSEQAGAVLDTHGGGDSELLGAFFFGGPGNVPMIRNDHASVFAAGIAEQVSASHHARGFLTLVREDQDGASRVINHLAAHGAVSRGVGSVLPAYAGRAGATAATPRPFLEPRLPAGEPGPERRVSVDPGAAVDIPFRLEGGPARCSARGLPAGLACDPASGRITGRVAVPGRHVVEVQAASPAGEAWCSFLLAVGVPGLTCPDELEVRLGEAVSFRLTASHGPASFAMQLPKGLVCAKDGTISGSLADPEKVGTFETEVRIEAPAGRFSHPFTLTVVP